MKRKYGFRVKPKFVGKLKSQRLNFGTSHAKIREQMWQNTTMFCAQHLKIGLEQCSSNR